MNISEFVLNSEASLLDAVERLHESVIDIILVMDKDTLLGVITDGDIRKSILLGASNEESILKHMNHSPVTLDNINLRNAFSLSYETNLGSIPVVINNKVTALFVRHLKNFITNEHFSATQEKIEKSTVALIMAGGEGKRLRPYTDNVPKSLARIGDTTLIERNLEQLAQAGLKRVFISVNYLSEMITSKLGDGSQYGLEIQYLEEVEKLGTAGPINFLKNKEFNNLIVLNADIVCNFLYSKLDSFHSNQNNDLTVVCSKNYLPITYGVVSANTNLEITKIEEKPIKEFWCAAGIYMFQKDALLESLPKELTYIDMPDLIKKFLKKNNNIKAFPLMPKHEKWFDVADLDDLEEINNQDWAHTI